MSGFWTIQTLKICRTSGPDLMSGRALPNMNWTSNYFRPIMEKLNHATPLFPSLQTFFYITTNPFFLRISFNFIFHVHRPNQRKSETRILSSLKSDIALHFFHSSNQGWQFLGEFHSSRNRGVEEYEIYSLGSSGNFRGMSYPKNTESPQKLQKSFEKKFKKKFQS